MMHGSLCAGTPTLTEPVAPRCTSLFAHGLTPAVNSCACHRNTYIIRFKSVFALRRMHSGSARPLSNGSEDDHGSHGRGRHLTGPHEGTLKLPEAGIAHESSMRPRSGAGLVSSILTRSNRILKSLIVQYRVMVLPASVYSWPATLEGSCSFR
jgi:hypothetical protein